MLEVKHLTKTYKSGTKGGTEVTALQDVSVSFEDTGLVFILGKSGCGKSTFLNCAGGLDAPTEGEIIVDGRSSKGFTQADWDSYRNTYVGFIFQEYNVLDGFSVADNVSLALELQGRKNERDKVPEILREVQLEDFADRRPNTLSGGQKQRVAIARALVKDPRIIMADEPTGALDSATGRQILDILKDLSRTRLVIVVSHDRDFAETFADRIIELEDGHIVSDTSQSLGQVIAKSAAKRPANEGSGSAFIRSRLPLGRAVRMGLNGLKVKPVRLVITIILSVVAFVMFGLLSCLMMYNGDTVAANTFATGDEKYFTLLKNSTQYNTYTYYDGREQAVTTSTVPSYYGPEDAAYFGYDASEVLYGCPLYSLIQNASWSSGTQWDAYSDACFRKVAYIPEGNSLRDGITGAYPSSEDEIAISSYMADCLTHCTFVSNGADGSISSYTPKAQENLIGLSVDTDFGTYKISGIIPTGDIPSQYSYMKTSADSKSSDIYNLNSYLMDGIDMCVFATPDLVRAFEEASGGTPFNSMLYFDATSGTVNLYYAGTSYDNALWSQATRTAAVYDETRDCVLDAVFADGRTDRTLSEGEVIISMPSLYGIISARCDTADAGSSLQTDLSALLDSMTAYMDGGYASGDGFTPLTEDEYGSTEDAVCEYLGSNPVSLAVYQSETYNTPVYAGAFNVAGFYYSEDLRDSVNPGIYISAEDFASTIAISYSVERTSDYVLPEDAVYEYMYIPVRKNISWVRSTLAKLFTTDESTGLYYYMSNILYSDINTTNSVVAVLDIVFLVAGIIFAVFAALLLYNFISVSIMDKKKDIGILRALGARGADVFKIFFSESAVIALICLVVAIILTAVLASVFNSVLNALYGIMVTVVVFTPLCILMMLAIAVIVAFLGTFIPVNITASRKPADAIRAL